MEDMTNNIIHENTVLKAGAYLATKQGLRDAISVGEHLISMGSDNLVTGGFWIWDVDKNLEFYSPKFREALGFEGIHDFPNVPESWQKQIEPDSLKIAMDNVGMVMTASKEVSAEATFCPAPYRQMVKYKKKNGGIVELFCSGTLLMHNGRPSLFVGTHKLKKR